MPILYGIRSYFNSILYNLISNAIKYRHSDRDCIINISTNRINDTCLIQVKDNGIGIDLEKHQNKMFGMYKRFHDHLDGKGLGLFLTKQQIDAMNGKIYVDSKINIGSQFSIELPSFPLSQIESQLFYNSEVIDIYLDAINNITTLKWKKIPTPIEFKNVFKKSFEIFKKYNSNLWILQSASFFNVKAQDLQWALDELLVQFKRLDILKIAVIRTYSKEGEIFWNNLFEVCKSKSIDIVFAKNITKAKEKLLNL